MGIDGADVAHLDSTLVVCRIEGDANGQPVGLAKPDLAVELLFDGRVAFEDGERLSSIELLEPYDYVGLLRDDAPCGAGEFELLHVAMREEGYQLTEVGGHAVQSVLFEGLQQLAAIGVAVASQ